MLYLVKYFYTINAYGNFIIWIFSQLFYVTIYICIILSITNIDYAATQKQPIIQKRWRMPKGAIKQHTKLFAR